MTKFKRLAIVITLTISILICYFPTSSVKADGAWLQWHRDIDISLTLVQWGKLNIIVSIWKLMNDGTPNYDWFFYKLFIEQVPGHVLAHTDPDHYTGNECNDKNEAWQRLWPYDTTSEKIVDHGPPGTQGQSTVSFGITGYGYTMTESYSFQMS